MVAILHMLKNMFCPSSYVQLGIHFMAELTRKISSTIIIENSLKFNFKQRFRKDMSHIGSTLFSVGWLAHRLELSETAVKHNCVAMQRRLHNPGML